MRSSLVFLDPVNIGGNYSKLQAAASRVHNQNIHRLAHPLMQTRTIGCGTRQKQPEEVNAMT